jgi:hypothetical protein
MEIDAGAVRIAKLISSLVPHYVRVRKGAAGGQDPLGVHGPPGNFAADADQATMEGMEGSSAAPRLAARTRAKDIFGKSELIVTTV